jgi:hypothetical protein
LKTKKNRPKTQTIKERAIYVYLPSHELVDEWKDLAKKQRLSISKFVMEHVQNSLKEETEPTYLTKMELSKRMRDQDKEISRLKDENKVLRLAFQNLDGELKHYRAGPFLDDDFEGTRGYEKELIKLLKSKKYVTGLELFDLLGLNPMDAELTKSITRQMENLEGYGLVKADLKGWRWVE